MRSVTARAASYYEHLRDSGLLKRWTDRGWVVETREIDTSTIDPAPEDLRYVLEHTALRFISYPYEWSFGALKSAALRHLDLQLDALAHAVQLVDASAYNVQFVGAQPVFIDLLSFRRYRDGDYWLGHRQFCEQFLNPLLLRALTGIPHNAWYRGSLEGISAPELNAVLPRRRKLSWNVFSHVTLPARVAARAAVHRRPSGPPRRPLPRASYLGLLTQLRGWIADLSPRGHATTTWSDYDTTHTYSDDEHRAKRALVAEFVARVRPSMLWDFGCNTGEYAELALESGAGSVVGFEADHGALDRAFARASERRLAFLPLHLDAANPSPDQGWAQQERQGLTRRASADAVIALAFAHHLAIGRNVPLDDVARWLTSMAPTGIIEFVQKDDPTVRLMLSAREDVFHAYSEEAFLAALNRHARVLRKEQISSSGRTIVMFERIRNP